MPPLPRAHDNGHDLLFAAKARAQEAALAEAQRKAEEDARTAEEEKIKAERASAAARLEVCSQGSYSVVECGFVL